MPADIDLTTLAALREELRLGADTSQDALLERYITASSRMMLQYAQRQFAPQETAATHTFSGRPGGYMRLSPYDLRGAPTSVTHATGGAAVTSTTLGADDYELYDYDEAAGVYTAIRVGTQSTWYSAWRSGGQPRIAILGNWGFPSVPEDVAQLCVFQVADWFRATQQTRTGMAVVSEEGGLGVPRYRRKLSRDTEQGLDVYRIAPVVA